MQNWFYFFEVLFLITGFVYSKIGGNELLWTVGLSCIYFSAVIMMILKLFAFVKRYKAQRAVGEDIVEVENNKVFPEKMELPEVETQKTTYNEIIKKVNDSKVEGI